MAIKSVGDLLHLYSNEEAAGNCLSPGNFFMALGNNHLLGRHMLNYDKARPRLNPYPSNAGGGREEGQAL